MNSLSGFKNGPLQYLVLTISIISDKAILDRDNTGYAYNCVGEVKYGLIKYTLLTHISRDDQARIATLQLEFANTERQI